MFSIIPLDVVYTAAIPLEIPLVDSCPYLLPYLCIPLPQFQEFKNHIRELKAGGLIWTSQSPFASLIVIVHENDGRIHLCIDYRQLDARTICEAHQCAESLDALGNAKYFSCLDLTSGYLQVQMAEEDRQKTAFTTPMGLYKYTRMPFGLTNAAATFQWLMAMVLGDMNYLEILLYLDDIIVFSPTVEEHLQRLKRVFSRLRQHGHKLKP